MAMNEAIAEMASIFNINELNNVQKVAISKFVGGDQDIFINLPTGYGKSIIYQSLPLVYDKVSTSRGHIVAVVSPLINLITDQVKYLNGLGVRAISLTATEREEERKLVERGEYSVVYGTPEAWLRNERWRSMLSNAKYSRKLCAIAVDEAHIIKQWDTSLSKKEAPFREFYSRLHELRTLAPNVKFIALTATATETTRDVIYHVLKMTSPYVIYESPNKANITYNVTYMPKDIDLDQYFGWLADELIANQDSCDRTIIYCQTIKQCGVLYGIMKGLIGKHMFIGSDPKNVVIEMLHSCTPEMNKENILKSFSDECGSIRVLIATIAFGMGVDCKGVKRVIHFGPSKNIESYAQETGRAGRDGSQSTVYLLYNGMLLAHVEKDIKLYIKSDHCRRDTLLKHFQANFTSTSLKHLCCDVCASKCDCGLPITECQQFASFPAVTKIQCYIPQKCRQVSCHQREMIKEELIMYHKKIATQLLKTTGNENLHILTDISFVIGFSEIHIQQIMDNVQHLFVLEDVYNFVEIWDIKHAYKILQVVGKVFGDLDSDFCHEDLELLEMDDTWSEEWDAFIEDEDLVAMAAENLPEVEHSCQVYQNLLWENNEYMAEQEEDVSDASSADLPDNFEKLNFTD